jgi:hypothetical protein
VSGIGHRYAREVPQVKVLILFVAWLALFVLCWPLALLALVVLPFVWLLSIPFRILVSVVEGILAFVKALFLLPARILRGL